MVVLVVVMTVTMTTYGGGIADGNDGDVDVDCLSHIVDGICSFQIFLKVGHQCPHCSWGKER